MVVDTVRGMNVCGSFPEVVVVGVGYPHGDSDLKQAFRETYRLRARDLTPVPGGALWQERLDSLDWLEPSEVITGGAESFLRFIETSAIPSVENRYRIRPSGRTLVGHSFGGLFVLYACFHQTQLFANYVAASPSLWYGSQITFDYERSYHDGHEDLPVHLYLAAGMREENPTHAMASNVLRFAALLRSREYLGLTLYTKVFDECDHCGAVAPELQNGLQKVLAG
jgi:predicted alpha/beta superfamily hydrolase